MTKNYNYSIFAELDNNKVFIKYSSRIKESLRKLIKDFESNNNIDNGLSRGVPSAVQIYAAIYAYARFSITKYKNIPGNPCVMSDTYSVVLKNPQNISYIRKELGQIKLEYLISEGIFIRKKLYALKTNDDKEIIKASGVKASKLIYNKLKLLLAGITVHKEGKSFNVKWSTLDIDIVNKTINLKGLQKDIIHINGYYHRISTLKLLYPILKIINL